MTSYSLFFPGQGSQFVGMGKDIYSRFATAKAIFEKADDVLDLALSRLCFDGPAEVLNDTANTQPAILVTSYALLTILVEEFGRTLQPTAIAGHSLGEYTALIASGSLSFEDGLTLVRKRGELMRYAGERSAGGMTAVIGADTIALSELINSIIGGTDLVLTIANDNCPGQSVLSGSPEALQQFKDRFKESGAKIVKRLPVSVACHSPLMAEAQKELDAALNDVTINRSNIDIIANTTGKPIREPQEIRNELASQLCGQILWKQTTTYLAQNGCTRFLEVGPGKVLSGLTKRSLPQSECINFSSTAQLKSALAFLGKKGE